MYSGVHGSAGESAASGFGEPLRGGRPILTVSKLMGEQPIMLPQIVGVDRLDRARHRKVQSLVNRGH